METKVFKFGGASVKDAEGILNMKAIIDLYSNARIVLVCSAMGKTTNLMEAILEAWYKRVDLTLLIHQLETYHLNIARQLTISKPLEDAVAPVIEQVKDLLQQKPTQNYDYDYDQLVSFGERLSTTLISAYLENYTEVSLANASELIITDDIFREAKVDWETTTMNIQRYFSANTSQIVVTQGFIGGTNSGLTTTLGREGSDFSASIFAHCLHTSEVTIWKDVAGMFNADPKLFPLAEKIDQLSYQDAIELAYYGASIIHPKTIKPLQNKNIPLYIKSFYDPNASGTIIDNNTSQNPIPCVIVKEQQVLVTIFPRDFSFIAANNLSMIYELCAEHRIRLNLMQNSALSFSLCTENTPRRLKAFFSDLAPYFKVKYNEDLCLITVRHYTDEIIEDVILDQEIVLEQSNRTIFQAIVRRNIT